MGMLVGVVIDSSCWLYGNNITIKISECLAPFWRKAMESLGFRLKDFSLEAEHHGDVGKLLARIGQRAKGLVELPLIFVLDENRVHKYLRRWEFHCCGAKKEGGAEAPPLRP
jgi:hypothetical protein